MDSSSENSLAALLAPSKTHHQGRWALFPQGGFVSCECECPDCWHAVEGCLCSDCTDHFHGHAERDERALAHFLDAYTWAGRRGACGLTGERLNAVHKVEDVTCEACKAEIVKQRAASEGGRDERA